MTQLEKDNIMPSIRSAFRRPLVAQHIRTFPNLSQAAAFIDRLTAARADSYRFNIQQTAADRWAVCRVISGGVQ